MTTNATTLLACRVCFWQSILQTAATPIEFNWKVSVHLRCHKNPIFFVVISLLEYLFAFCLFSTIRFFPHYKRFKTSWIYHIFFRFKTSLWNKLAMQRVTRASLSGGVLSTLHSLVRKQINQPPNPRISKVFLILVELYLVTNLYRITVDVDEKLSSEQRIFKIWIPILRQFITNWQATA